MAPLAQRSQPGGAPGANINRPMVSQGGWIGQGEHRAAIFTGQCWGALHERLHHNTAAKLVVAEIQVQVGFGVHRSGQRPDTAGAQ